MKLIGSSIQLPKRIVIPAVVKASRNLHSGVELRFMGLIIYSRYRRHSRYRRAVQQICLTSVALSCHIANAKETRKSEGGLPLGTAVGACAWG